MDHNFFLNHHSLPAQSSEAAYSMLFDACQGMLSFRIQTDDRIFLFYDEPGKKGIGQCLLAKDYTYQNFLDSLSSCGEQDLCLFLLECEDKSPAIDQDEFNDNVLEEMASWSCYLPGNTAYNGNLDALCMANCLEPRAVLLSLPTKPEWSDVLVNALILKNNREEPFSLSNISKQEHGIYWHNHFKESLAKSLADLYPTCTFSPLFIQWFNDLDKNNQRRIKDKLSLAVDCSFQGGKPFFDSLEASEGLREIRFYAVAGGAVRILFKMRDRQCAILTGFIKKNNSEGYDVQIPIANQQWSRLFG